MAKEETTTVAFNRPRLRIETYLFFDPSKFPAPREKNNQIMPRNASQSYSQSGIAKQHRNA
jgi:hypothetical protein